MVMVMKIVTLGSVEELYRQFYNKPLPSTVFQEYVNAQVVLRKLQDTYPESNVILAGGALYSWIVEGSPCNDLDIFISVPEEHLVEEQNGHSVCEDFLGRTYGMWPTAPYECLGSTAYSGSEVANVTQVSTEDNPPYQLIYHTYKGVKELLGGFPDNLSTQFLGAYEDTVYADRTSIVAKVISRKEHISFNYWMAGTSINSREHVLKRIKKLHGRYMKLPEEYRTRAAVIVARHEQLEKLLFEE